MMSNILIIIFSGVTSAAAVAMVIVSRNSFQLNKSLQKKSEKHEQAMKDLLKAFVIAQLCVAHGGEQVSIGLKRFNRFYGGETPIFPTEECSNKTAAGDGK